ncbi:MAG: NAD(P)-binding domain-containing protein, partial [Deltaproteobacteria bacterium]|nr:NAD(P)-binding domain-containing protein [Deltaproteobacteria bacterium]
MTADQIRHITIVGAGLMGHGIAQEFALAGYEVRLHSRKQESLQTALKHIQTNLERLVGLGMVTREQAEAVPARLHPTSVLAQAVVDADVVIESVPEDTTIKHQIFQALDTLCPAHTILASNTSTLPLSQFATGLRRSDKVLVAHYANPPYLIPLVELVRGPETSDDT